MKRYIKSWLLWGVLLVFFNTSFGFCQADNAYQHLYDVMDKYHKTFDVYTDQDAGGNHFSPCVIGNYNALKISSGDTSASPFDSQSIKISYNDTVPPNINWAGVYWLFPDTNWGYWNGLNISGAEKLSFWAKGEKGGEKVEFKMGGVNLYSDPDSAKKHYDSCDLLSTGIRTLSADWEEFSIDLSKKDSFAVYLDGDAGSNNRYYPSGWYNGSNNMKVDPNWIQNPHSGSSCFRVEWNGRPGKDGWKWNGVLWQYPENNWGEKPGYDLTGATKLTFWARTDERGLKINFLVGIKGKDSCGEVTIGYTSLDVNGNWAKYAIDLSGMDLSNVRGGFGFTFNDVNDPDPDGCVFYLDDIQFDKPLKKELDNIIGGFCCAIEKNRNPNGCAFYLDNIRYQLSPQAQIVRLQQPRFLVSYETTSDSSDLFLRNAGYIYDNALAMIAFMARGTEEDWKRAEILAKTFSFCQNHDRYFEDGRLRNGYKSGDIADPETGYAGLPGIWDEVNNRRIEDYFSTNSHTGNLAWVAIALLGFCKDGKGKPFLDPAVLDSAKSTSIKIGNWICDITRNNTLGPPGFVGGYEKGGDDLVKWKSSEHNLDAYIAFSQLAQIDYTNTEKWHQWALYARTFIDSMWNSHDNYFCAGTDSSGKINFSFFEDVQTWGLLAALCTDSIESIPKKYLDAVYRVEDSCYVKDCVKHCNFQGFDFNTDRDGVWFEGTAHMALAYSNLKENNKAEQYLQQLRNAQTTANHNNGKGIVAACHDGVSTGLNWVYLNRLHIGATAWYILAELGYNPYYTMVEDTQHQMPVLPNDYILFQNYPNPFNSKTTIIYFLPQSSKVTLQIFNINGQLVKTLVDTKKKKNYYTVHWDGTNYDGCPVTSGLYFYRLGTDFEIITKKMLLVR